MHWDMPTWMTELGPMYVDRAGNEIQAMRWRELRRDYGYKVLRKTPVAGVLEVSTVWLGFSHNIVGPPLVFETMVFEIAESNSIYGFRFHASDGEWTYRYSTEAEALAGHEEVVADVRSHFLPVPYAR